MSARRAGLVVVSFVLSAAVLLSACADDAGEGAAVGGGGSVERAPARAGDAGGALYAAEPEAQGELRPGSAVLPRIGPAVIKTADVGLEVPRGDFHDAFEEARDVADRHGGFVVSTEVDDERSTSGSVTLRVPADRFEEALADLEELGDVEEEVVRGEDVSEEFVDLEARLRNLEAQEAVLLRLMDRSKSVSDTIRVQRELTGVQLEIERIRGRLRFLEDQTAMSTISVSLVEVGAAPRGRPGALARAWQQAVDVFFAVISALIVATGFIVPVALLAALALVVFRVLRPRFQAPV